MFLESLLGSPAQQNAILSLKLASSIHRCYKQLILIKKIMNWTSGLSTLAAILTFATFYMHGEQKIRTVAMTANAAFFILHTALLIMNGHRLRKLLRCTTHSPDSSSFQEDKNTQRSNLSRNIPSSPSGINMYQWNNNRTPR